MKQGSSLRVSAISVSVLLLALLFSAEAAVTSQLWTKFQQQRSALQETSLPDFSYVGYAYGNSAAPYVTGPVFSVTNFGAVANDDLYDDEAIQAAINAAQAAGGGVVTFPAGRFLVSPTADTKDSIRVSGSNIVLRGAGSGSSGTEIVMMNMKSVDHTYMFLFKPEHTSSSYLALITATAERQTFGVQVDDVSKLSVGQSVVIDYSEPDYTPIYFGSLGYDTLWSQTTSHYSLGEIHTIKAIDEESRHVWFTEPIMTSLQTHNKFFRLVARADISEIGVEDIKFTGRWDTLAISFTAHRSTQDDSAFCALMFNSVTNGWVRNVVLSNFNEALWLERVAQFTVDSVTLQGKPAHISIHTRRSYGVLVKSFVDQQGQFRGPSTGLYNANTVFLRASMTQDQRVDSTGGLPYATLFDAVTGGKLTKMSGDLSVYPNHGKDMVFWNFQHKATSPDDVYYYDFWPLSRADYNTFTASQKANSHTVVMPTFAGLWGNNVRIRDQSVTANDQQGAAVEPASLYEAQLAFRTSSLPAVLSAAAADILSAPTGFVELSPQTPNPLPIPAEGEFTVDVAYNCSVACTLLLEVTWTPRNEWVAGSVAHVPAGQSTVTVNVTSRHPTSLSDGQTHLALSVRLVPTAAYNHYLPALFNSSLSSNSSSNSSRLVVLASLTDVSVFVPRDKCWGIMCVFPFNNRYYVSITLVLAMVLFVALGFWGYQAHKRCRGCFQKDIQLQHTFTAEWVQLTSKEKRALFREWSDLSQEEQGQLQTADVDEQKWQAKLAEVRRLYEEEQQLENLSDKRSGWQSICMESEGDPNNGGV